MTLFRPVTCVAAALALLAGGAAGAAAPSSRSCTVILDPAGDATEADMGVAAAPSGSLPSDDYLDLLSARLASDAETVTTALRVKAIGLDVTSPQSYFMIAFKVAGQRVAMFANWAPDTGWFYFWDNEATGANGDAAGRVDTSRNEIRMTVDATQVSPRFRPGTKLTDIEVRTGRFLPIGLGAFADADGAATQRPHVVGSHSCLTPVRQTPA